mgnify:FL=1
MNLNIYFISLIIYRKIIHDKKEDNVHIIIEINNVHFPKPKCLNLQLQNKDY